MLSWLLGGLAVLAALAIATVKKYWLPNPPEDPADPVNPSLATNPPTMPQKVYEIAKANLGNHLTLDPSVPEEVGCCEALSFILEKAGYQMPTKGIPGVNALIAWMQAKGFQEATEGSIGAIITAHSPDYYNPAGAHVGVVMEYGICSNTSANGLWQENYPSIQAWESGFPQSTTRFFLPC